MIPNSRLNAQEVREASLSIVKEHLSVAAAGYVVTTEMLVDVLFKAAAERISIEAACADLEQVADSNSIREHLNGCFAVEQLRQAEAEMNAGLAARIPIQFFEHRLEVAMDYHDEAFYGKSPELLKYCCSGQAKAGTTHFFRIATAYVIYRQLRLTLAITYVLPQDATETVVQRLYERLQKLRLRMAVLYLDKGFCTGPILRYLQRQRQPALLACPIRGKQGGTRRLCQGRKSYRTRYTFTDGTTAEVAVVATLVPDKTKRRRRKWLLFVLVHLDWSPQTVYRRYRRRFGIECSYRLLRQIRIKTTSRNPALRFFLLGFALLLINVWAIVRWVVARLPGPGPYRMDALLLHLHQFVALLKRAVEQLYGVSLSIHTNFAFDHST